MKKVYALFIGAMLATASFGQISADWWDFLPVDFASNPAPRTQLPMTNVPEDVLDFPISDLWDFLAADPANVVVCDVYQDSASAARHEGAADFDVQTAVGYNTWGMFVVYNITDDVLGGDEVFETAVAPYDTPYDPKRTIYSKGWEPNAEDVMKDSFPDDWNFWGRRISGADYLAMANYGIWNETGAGKIAFGYNTIGDTLLPGILDYSSLLVNDTLVFGAPGGGAVTENCVSYNLPFGDGTGFFKIFGFPWAQFQIPVGDGSFTTFLPDSANPEMDGISIGYKVVDNDKGAVGMWLEGTANGAYSMVVWYGAVADIKFVVIEDAVKDIKAINAYAYASGSQIEFRGANVKDVAVYSTSGKLVMRSNVSNNSVSHNLNKGVYVLRLNTDKGVASAKLVL